MKRLSLLALTLSLALSASRAAATCDGRLLSLADIEFVDVIAPPWRLVGEGWIDNARYRFFSPDEGQVPTAMIVETIRAQGVIETDRTWEKGSQEFRVSSINDQEPAGVCARPVTPGQDVARIFQSIQAVWRQR